jgi:hypothetical protein
MRPVRVPDQHTFRLGNVVLATSTSPRLTPKIVEGLFGAPTQNKRGSLR